MRRVLMAALVVALATPCLNAAQAVRDYVVARVGDEAIFATDVRAAIGLGIVELGAHPDPEEAALQGLIERRLMLREILRGTSPPDPGADAIDMEVERMKSYAAATLKTVMTANGVDEALLRRIARDTLRIQSYLNTRFPRLDVSNDDARQYFRLHPEAFRRNGELMTFDQASAAAHDLAAQERRSARIDQWLTGLKKRTEVTRPGKPAGVPSP
jgi:hypothetical protein